MWGRWGEQGAEVELLHVLRTAGVGGGKGSGKAPKGRQGGVAGAIGAKRGGGKLCAQRAQLQNSRTASALGERSYRTATRTDMDRHGRFFRGQSAEVRGQEEPGGGFRVRGSGWGTRKRGGVRT